MEKVQNLRERNSKFATSITDEIVKFAHHSMTNKIYKRNGDQPELMRPTKIDIAKTVGIITDTEALLKSMQDNFETGLFDFQWPDFIRLVHQMRNEGDILADQLMAYQAANKVAEAKPLAVEAPKGYSAKLTGNGAQVKNV